MLIDKTKKLWCPQHREEPDAACPTCASVDRHVSLARERRAWAAQHRKTPFLFEGIDMRQQLREFARLPAFEGADSQLRIAGVWNRLRVIWSSTATTSGRATTSSVNPAVNRIRVTVGPRSSRAGLLETLLHELVHVSLPHEQHHSEEFILRLARAAREAWGLRVPHPLETPRGTRSCVAYAVDDIIRDELRAKLESGEIRIQIRIPIRIPIAPVEEPPDRNEQRRRQVERRAQRARKMLEHYERTSRRVAKLVGKWRRTVRYYEREAAKRESSAASTGKKEHHGNA